MRAQKILALPKWEPKKWQPSPKIYQPPPPPQIFNDRSLIVSSELNAVHPCVTISFYKKPTISLFFAHMITIKIQKQPKGESLWQSSNDRLLLYGPEQRGIPMDFMSDLTRQDSLLQKSLCLWDHNQQHHRASAWQFYHWTEWPVYFEADS